MVRKIKAKLVLQLRNQSLSRRSIESAHKISRHSIQAVLDAAELAGLVWDDVAEMSEDEVYTALFPGRGVRQSVFAQLDWDRVHTEMARVGVTLRLFTPGVCGHNFSRRAGGHDLNRFCWLYIEHGAMSGASSRVGGKAGRSIEVDWSVPLCSCWIRLQMRSRRCISSSSACRSADMHSWTQAWIWLRTRGCALMRRCSLSSAAAFHVWCPTI